MTDSVTRFPRKGRPMKKPPGRSGGCAGWVRTPTGSPVGVISPSRDGSGGPHRLEIVGCDSKGLSEADNPETKAGRPSRDGRPALALRHQPMKIDTCGVPT